MSHSAAANPAAPPHPPASRPEADRGASTTAPTPNDHVVADSATTSSGSSSSQPPRSSPFLFSLSSLSSSISKAPPSVSGSRTTSMTATSLPTTVGPGPDSVDGPGPRSSRLSTNMSFSPHLSSGDSQLHVAEARAALIASMSNMLDSELQSRASLLHSNAAALSRQEKDVAKASEALRRENDKLAKVAKDAGRKIKELGNVQNWAEVLERDFLVLEETMRLVRDSSPESDEDCSCSQCSSSYYSLSENEGDDAERSGSRIRASNGDSVNGDKDERNNWQDAVETQKGKGLDGAALNSRSSIIAEGSAFSNTSPNGPASKKPDPASATVSLDDAVLESLAEALATDIRIRARATGQNATS
ncbi:hypothetical protein GGS21DRAFT_292989 [Xylaria nigripes]|nr:hypothetical protein GGS21DRAFT_292989 [Xylaria nigripes]